MTEYKKKINGNRVIEGQKGVQKELGVLLADENAQRKARTPFLLVDRGDITENFVDAKERRLRRRKRAPPSHPWRPSSVINAS